MRLINVTNGAVLGEWVEEAVTRRERRRGLLDRESLENGCGMYFKKCRQVQTIWMRFPIDVLFIDRAGVLLRVLHSLPPGKISPVVWHSRLVIELPAGVCRATGTAVGHAVELLQA